MRTFTLVPVGGLGNRLHAISSAISYCQKKDIFLTILWFKDKGLNCNYKELFSIIPSIQNVAIQDNGWLDLLLRDNPRKRNFYIPRFFEKRMYEKCIYYYDDDFHVHDSNPELDDTLDGYDSVYMVTCSDYWQFPVPNNWMKVTDEIENRVLTVEKEFGENTIGVHIRRTDNWNTIKNSPLSLYTDAIDAEISRDSSVRVFLATDSLEEKEKLRTMYGNRIITITDGTRRDTENGIKDAFVEMCLLANTNRIYAGFSSFSIYASKMRNTEFVLLDLNKKGVHK